MHILIVDDEPLARSRLRTLLADCAQCGGEHHSVCEAAHAADALAQLHAPGGRAVDVVLLDIHMPGQDGLSLAHHLQQLPQPPAIVFVTAHADHALTAFELDAVDYLTKPVRLQRLQQALAKARRTGGPADAPPRPASAPPPDGEALVIQTQGRTERVPLADVLYLRAEQKYLTVRTALRSYVIDGALTELEARHAAHFLRVHRNTLVSRRAMRALERHVDPDEGEGWAVRLHGLAELLPVSRRQVAAVREAIAG
ncbi:LytTR family DNA-binding domain-containing protein [Acidovorax sp. MR-S7]|uniref:LytR/AlgR family response regulator transcription factor n=1 Tax=Acidovorax sp. MR-S7 TaxID=1268622 RepID=UPI00037FBBCE|nr:LytTR family DNA-binding domain-containing protein [Acidovorax sp. MR-S7]GAD22466.1 response regulator of the LytR/AlgR family [Acidovorax sp. MR-S7]